MKRNRPRERLESVRITYRENRGKGENTIHAGVAGEAREGDRLRFGLFLLGESTRHFRFGRSGDLGSNRFRGAVDHVSVVDEALDEPVALVRAMGAGGHATIAKVVVTLIAHPTMVMSVSNRLVTGITVNGPG